MSRLGGPPSSSSSFWRYASTHFACAFGGVQPTRLQAELSQGRPLSRGLATCMLVRETGILLPNNQRQNRTSHALKDVLPLRTCANDCAPCQPLLRDFFRIWLKTGRSSPAIPTPTSPVISSTATSHRQGGWRACRCYQSLS